MEAYRSERSWTDRADRRHAAEHRPVGLPFEREETDADPRRFDSGSLGLEEVAVSGGRMLKLLNLLKLLSALASRQPLGAARTCLDPHTCAETIANIGLPRAAGGV